MTSSIAWTRRCNSSSVSSKSYNRLLAIVRSWMNLGNVRVSTGRVSEVGEAIEGWMEDSLVAVRMAGIWSANEGIKRIGQHHVDMVYKVVDFLYIPHVCYHRVIVFIKQGDARYTSRERGGISRFWGWWRRDLNSRRGFKAAENSLERHCRVQFFVLSP